MVGLRTPSAFLLLLCSAFAVAQGAAPSEGELRTAVGKALPFVEARGKAWIDERGCVSCHQVPSMLRCMEASATKGFAVSRPYVEETTEWSARWEHWTNQGAKGGKIGLFGGEGVGKTVLVQGLAAGLGVAEEITSPSFVLMVEHHGRLTLYHVDLYRLDGRLDDELLDNLADYQEAGGVCARRTFDAGPAYLAGSKVRSTIRSEAIFSSSARTLAWFTPAGTSTVARALKSVPPPIGALSRSEASSSTFTPWAASTAEILRRMPGRSWPTSSIMACSAPSPNFSFKLHYMTTIWINSNTI